jgi:hypothetical protein
MSSNAPMTSDERALRSALTDAAVGQPPAPYDRIDGVRRRHARGRQRRMVALGAAAVVAVAGTASGVIGVRAGTGNATPVAHRNVPSWALQWPEHRDPSIPQNVLDGAVSAWAHSHQTDTATNDPTDPDFTVWYLAEKVAGDDIAVAFEYSGGGAPYFVMGYATASEVMKGQVPYDTPNGFSPWVLRGVSTLDMGPRSIVGLNLPVSGSDTGEGAANDIVVLTDPRATSFDWQVLGPDGELRHVTSPMAAGYAEMDTGLIRSRVRITAVKDRHGTVLGGGTYVTVPTTESVSPAPDTPVLMKVRPFTGVPESADSFGEFSGQGGIHNEVQSDTPWPRHGTRIYAACYGGPRMVVSIDSNRPSQQVAIPCDNREHIVTGPPVLAHSEIASEAPRGTHVHAVEIDASDYTAWRLVVLPR